LAVVWRNAGEIKALNSHAKPLRQVGNLSAENRYSAIEKTRCREVSKRHVAVRGIARA
jgi:hypothetical protein